jgi:hypothetical protein
MVQLCGHLERLVEHVWRQMLRVLVHKQVVAMGHDAHEVQDLLLVRPVEHVHRAFAITTVVVDWRAAGQRLVARHIFQDSSQVRLALSRRDFQPYLPEDRR